MRQNVVLYELRKVGTRDSIRFASLLLCTLPIESSGAVKVLRSDLSHDAEMSRSCRPPDERDEYITGSKSGALLL